MENNPLFKKYKISLSQRIKSWMFWKPIVWTLVGIIGGYLYYHFVGCNSGTCAITSNPIYSSLWGGLLGLFIAQSPCMNGKC